jgi:intracellular sulfur oxidation DsrE/DsrF family protein
MKTVLVLGRYGMGEGDPTLGMKILGTFLRKSPKIRDLHAIVLFNGGVKLAIEGSPVLAELAQLHENGVEVYPCGTCLEFFGLKDKVRVGGVSNMDAIIGVLSAAEKLITL